MSSSLTLVDVNGKRDVHVAPMAMGLMNFTWRDVPVPDEQAFAAIKAAIDAVAKRGKSKIVVNSATFYGPPGNGSANLDLLGRFFKTYPEHRDDVFLVVKGGLNSSFSPDASKDFLRSDLQNIKKHIGDKALDCFDMARVDQKIPIEKAVQTLKELAGEGFFTHLALSEAGAQTCRRANAAVPIALHEIEYSAVSLDIEDLGIRDACAEQGIPILAYSPLGRGLLTGSIKSRSDIPAGDVRLRYDRFLEENIGKNVDLYKHFEALAARKKCSTATLSLAWLLRQKGHIIPLFGTTRTAGVAESFEALNLQLSQQDLDDMRSAIDKAKPAGGRASAHGQHLMAADTPAV